MRPELKLLHVAVQYPFHAVRGEVSTENHEWDGRACPVGLFVRDLIAIKQLPADTLSTDYHTLSEAIGVPVQLLHAMNDIFIGLVETWGKDRFSDRPGFENAYAWPNRFLSRARFRDLSRAWPKFVMWLVTNEAFGLQFMSPTSYTLATELRRWMNGDIKTDADADVSAARILAGRDPDDVADVPAELHLFASLFDGDEAQALPGLRGATRIIERGRDAKQFWPAAAHSLLDCCL